MSDIKWCEENSPAVKSQPTASQCAATKPPRTDGVQVKSQSTASQCVATKPPLTDGVIRLKDVQIIAERDNATLYAKVNPAIASDQVVHANNSASSSLSNVSEQSSLIKEPSPRTDCRSPKFDNDASIEKKTARKPSPLTACNSPKLDKNDACIDKKIRASGKENLLCVHSGIKLNNEMECSRPTKNSLLINISQAKKSSNSLINLNKTNEMGINNEQRLSGALIKTLPSPKETFPKSVTKPFKLLARRKMKMPTLPLADDSILTYPSPPSKHCHKSKATTLPELGEREAATCQLSGSDPSPGVRQTDRTENSPPNSQSTIQQKITKADSRDNINLTLMIGSTPVLLNQTPQYKIIESSISSAKSVPPPCSVLFKTPLPVTTSRNKLALLITSNNKSVVSMKPAMTFSENAVIPATPVRYPINLEFPVDIEQSLLELSLSPWSCEVPLMDSFKTLVKHDENAEEIIHLDDTLVSCQAMLASEQSGHEEELQLDKSDDDLFGVSEPGDEILKCSVDSPDQSYMPGIVNNVISTNLVHSTPALSVVVNNDRNCVMQSPTLNARKSGGENSIKSKIPVDNTKNLKTKKSCSASIEHDLRRSLESLHVGAGEKHDEFGLDITDPNGLSGILTQLPNDLNIQNRLKCNHKTNLDIKKCGQKLVDNSPQNAAKCKHFTGSKTVGGEEVSHQFIHEKRPVKILNNECNDNVSSSSSKRSNPDFYGVLDMPSLSLVKDTDSEEESFEATVKSYALDENCTGTSLENISGNDLSKMLSVVDTPKRKCNTPKENNSVSFCQHLQVSNSNFFTADTPSRTHDLSDDMLFGSPSPLKYNTGISTSKNEFSSENVLLDVKSVDLATDRQLRIIDVCLNPSLLKTFLMELQTKPLFSMHLAYGNHDLQSNRKLIGAAIVWGGLDAYYISIQAVGVGDPVTLNERLDALRAVIGAPICGGTRGVGESSSEGIDDKGDSNVAIIM